MLAFIMLTSGCATQSADPVYFFQLTADSPAHRTAQTRHFETGESDELLSASAAVLQDLGFQVSESSRELGFLRAAKERSAREYRQEITRSVIAFFTSLLLISGSNTIQLIPVDLHQQINASLVARSIDEARTRYEVRIVFYRLVWKGDGQSGDQYILPGQQRMEMIRDPGIYQTFFARLSKAVFLEGHKI